MKSSELKKKYIEFFKKKGHKEIVNSSLIPENDPTVLFTTAGMHPLVPYLLGEKHPSGKRLVNVQKCIRTVDIDEVGDACHHTFFEMLGNWSVGDYWKKEAIEFTFEFLTEVLKIPVEKLGITVFGGDKKFPKMLKDDESVEIWESLKIPKERIVYLKGGVEEQEDNWWGPAGATGPCGPCTEMFYYVGGKVPKRFDAENKNWVEIGNDVLMEYNKTGKGFDKAKQQNIDFGGGVERLCAVINGLDDNYLIDTFKPLIEKIEKLSKKKYGKEGTENMRIIADHLKASCFILNENIEPSNVEQGYVLRRLIRRSIRHGRLLGINHRFCKDIIEEVFKVYEGDYKFDKKFILSQIEKEEEKFDRSLNQGTRVFEKEIKKGKKLDGKVAFVLFSSYGFPLEMTEELAKEKGIKINKEEFEKEFEKHRKLSRTATEGKFKSGLADHSEKTKKLHTATHLLLQA